MCCCLARGGFVPAGDGSSKRNKVKKVPVLRKLNVYLLSLEITAYIDRFRAFKEYLTQTKLN